MKLRPRRLSFSERTAVPRSRRFGTFCSLALAFWSGASFASFEFSNERWDSMSEFLAIARETLGEKRIVLTAQLNWAGLSPSDAVMVIHPTARVEFAEASAFLAAGGRLAMLDDFGQADELLERFHIQRISAPRQPKESIHENPSLQIARPHVSEGPGAISLRHPIVRHAEQVITNHPTALSTDSTVELTPVLTLSGTDGESSLFALIGVIGDANACGLNSGTPQYPHARCGRLFAMADPSVFINLMLGFEGNRDFARGLLEYLVDDDSWGARQGKLYVLVNDFQQTGHYGADTGLQRRLESALHEGQELLDTVKKDGLPATLSWLLATLAVIATSAWAFRSSGRLYKRAIPRYARPTPVVAQGGAAGRAAVLAAPSTHPTLVVLELKAAAEELCRQALSLPARASTATILAAIQQRGALSPRSTKVLEKLLARMAGAERAVVASESLRLSTESVKDMHAELQPILEELTPKYGDRV